jgi:hypothetical protein
MKELRKLVTAVLTVALMITPMNVAFAVDSATQANADKAVTLKDLGLYQGQDANDPKVGLENALTTQDSLIFLSKLFGYNEAANSLTADDVAEALAKFDDAASISEYAKNVVAYSATRGILSGSTQNGKYFVGAKDTVSAARFATFMLKQMGYSVADYKVSVAKLAETKGSKVDATITGDLTIDDAVGVMYGALTAEKASGKTVIADIIGDNADLKAKAEKLGLLPVPVTTDEVAVESIKVLNCKQIEIVFNQEMDKNSAESEIFYEIYDKGSNKVELGDSSASLGDDKKTVIITLNKNVDDKLTNSSKAKVTVKKNIKAARGVTLAEAISAEVEVEDGIIPTVSSVKDIGERNIKITFSEPVYDEVMAKTSNPNSITLANFRVKSGTYEYFVKEATLDNNVINLEVGTKLIEGPITVTVNDAGLDKEYAIADYAGYKVFKGDFKFDYVKDTSVSVVTVKSAKANKVVLSFSKPVKGSNIRLYYGKNYDESKKAKEVTVTRYVDEITFTFNTSLPSGPGLLYLVNSQDKNEGIKDSYGIKVPDQPISCYIEEELPEELPEEITNESEKESSSSHKKADTTAYDEIVGSLPKNNNNDTYTTPSWEKYKAEIANCKLTLTERDGQSALDAEVTKIKAVLAMLEKVADVDISDYMEVVGSLPENNDDSTYTASSWGLYVDNKGECRLDLTAKDGQAALDAEVIKIKKALAVLEKVADVDISDYMEVVGLLPENNENFTYTIPSWEVYKVAIADCDLTLTAENGQKALNDEISRIREAFNLLKLTVEVDTTDYDEIVATVGELVETKYTPESWEDYEAAIANCDLTLEAKDGQEALNEQISKIQKALDLLKEE